MPLGGLDVRVHLADPTGRTRWGPDGELDTSSGESTGGDSRRPVAAARTAWSTQAIQAGIASTSSTGVGHYPQQSHRWALRLSSSAIDSTSSPESSGDLFLNLLHEWFVQGHQDCQKHLPAYLLPWQSQIVL